MIFRLALVGNNHDRPKPAARWIRQLPDRHRDEIPFHDRSAGRFPHRP